MMRPLSRRALLRGAAGVAVGLPFLQIMAGRTARAAELPRRLLHTFAGVSGGTNGDPTAPLRMTPTGAGAAYTLPPAMAALDRVRSRVSVVAGLEIPHTAATETPPAGSMLAGTNAFHHHANPIFTGMRQVGDPLGVTVTGSSVDQVMARHSEAEVVFPSLAYRVQASFYQADEANRGILSYREEDGAVSPIVPQTSPLQAYLSLTNQVQPADTAAREAWEAARLRQRSVLDVVDRRMGGLLPSLGAADRQRLELHFDLLRDLEVRLSSAYAVEGGICVPDGLTEEPALDEARAWSDETTRARLFDRVIALAMSCDLSRAYSLMYTTLQSNLYMGDAIGFPELLHDIFHDGDGAAGDAAIAWHVECFVELIETLDTVPEADGTVLDRCAVLLLPEGGYGPLSPESPQDERWSHSGRDMVCVVAGNGDRLVLGELVDRAAAPLHPSRLMNALLASVDVDEEVGELPGTVPEILR